MTSYKFDGGNAILTAGGYEIPIGAAEHAANIMLGGDDLNDLLDQFVHGIPGEGKKTGGDETNEPSDEADMEQNTIDSDEVIEVVGEGNFEPLDDAEESVDPSEPIDPSELEPLDSEEDSNMNATESMNLNELEPLSEESFENAVENPNPSSMDVSEISIERRYPAEMISETQSTVVTKPANMTVETYVVTMKPADNIPTGGDPESEFDDINSILNL